MKKLVREQILEQALADVADREGKYGSPLDNYNRLAKLMDAWNEIAQTEDGKHRPVDGVVFQIMSNLARLAENPAHKPTWENLAGYAAIGAEVTQ